MVTDRGIEGPPDLVVEVLSPSTAARDRGVKLERYRLYGVPEYWVVDPDRETVEVWSLGKVASDPVMLERSETLRWQPIPGEATLDITLAELFGPI